MRVIRSSSVCFVPFLLLSSLSKRKIDEFVRRVGLLWLGKRIENIERFHPPRFPLFSELVRVCICVYARARLFRRDTNLNENVDPSWVLEEGEIL